MKRRSRGVEKRSGGAEEIWEAEKEDEENKKRVRE